MPNDDLDAIRRMAEDLGLTRFNETHLRQLLAATRAAQARRQSLPFGSLTPADEPAHVYSLNDE
jgi:hypothetical protein